MAHRLRTNALRNQNGSRMGSRQISDNLLGWKLKIIKLLKRKCESIYSTFLYSSWSFSFSVKFFPCIVNNQSKILYNVFCNEFRILWQQWYEMVSLRLLFTQDHTPVSLFPLFSVWVCLSQWFTSFSSSEFQTGDRQLNNKRLSDQFHSHYNTITSAEQKPRQASFSLWCYSILIK